MAAASACCLRSLLSSPPFTAASARSSGTSMPLPPSPAPSQFGFATQGLSSLSSLGSRTHLKQPFVRVTAEVSAIPSPSTTEVKEYILPSWAEFELGMAPVFWKTMNGLPPTSGESLTLFYNPAATNLVPIDGYGIAFNGGFNQPIMCGSEPRIMTRKNRGKADPPIFTIRIRVPKHAIKLIFSFTNGTEWDGPYCLPFQTLKMWRNKPLSFFNEGLAHELSEEGACDRAIFPDPNNVVASCAIGNLYAAGGDRCKLNLVSGCMDPSSPMYNPLAIVDDGSCPLEIESDEE